jgi:hypothetical protein
MNPMVRDRVYSSLTVNPAQSLPYPESTVPSVCVICKYFRSFI